MEPLPRRVVMRVACIVALVALALATAPVTARGQAPGHDASPGSPVWRVGGYLGAAQNSVDGIFPGGARDRDHRFLGLTAAATVLEVSRVSLAYAPCAVPLMIVTNNPTYGYVRRRVQGGGTVLEPAEVGRAPVAGTALTPFGMELDVALRRRWHAYGNSAAGGVWFTRDVPVIASSKFNFTFEVGGGLLWEYRGGRWLELGYKFHHLSNAGSGQNNPGLNANLIYLGWQRRVGGRHI